MSHNQIKFGFDFLENVETGSLILLIKLKICCHMDFYINYVESGVGILQKIYIHVILFKKKIIWKLS